MQIIESNGMALLRFENVEDKWPLRHVVSTRLGGMSPPPYDSLNVGIQVGDNPLNVIENRRRVCRAIGAPTDRFIALQQSHTANVFVLTSEKSFGGFAQWNDGQKNVDAIVTNLKNTTLFTMAADCTMSLFFDPIQEVLALAHAGWHGAYLNIHARVLELMKLEFRTKWDDVFVGISPSISKNNYPVPFDRIEKLIRLYGSDKAGKFYSLVGNNYYLDICAIIRYQLIELGVKNIECSGYCTVERHDLFYSWRRDHGKTGRFGLFAYLV